MLCALIMAGGKGTRFWPLSTEEKPKQFLSLIEEDTMIQMTVKRLLGIIPLERIFISTAVIKYFGFSVAFKNDINILGFFSLPNIFLNTKSILGSSNPLI